MFKYNTLPCLKIQEASEKWKWKIFFEKSKKFPLIL